MPTAPSTDEGPAADGLRSGAYDCPIFVSPGASAADSPTVKGGPVYLVVDYRGLAKGTRLHWTPGPINQQSKPWECLTSYPKAPDDFYTTVGADEPEHVLFGIKDKPACLKPGAPTEYRWRVDVVGRGNRAGANVGTSIRFTSRGEASATVSCGWDGLDCHPKAQEQQPADGKYFVGVTLGPL